MSGEFHHSKMCDINDGRGGVTPCNCNLIERIKKAKEAAEKENKKLIFRTMVATLRTWNGGGFSKDYFNSKRGRDLYDQITKSLTEE